MFKQMKSKNRSSGPVSKAEIDLNNKIGKILFTVVIVAFILLICLFIWGPKDTTPAKRYIRVDEKTCEIVSVQDYCNSTGYCYFYDKAVCPK